MKCKSCKQKIPEGSIFCNHCGVRQGRAPKQRDEIRVPEPKQLPSGAWRIQLRAEGESVTEDTAAKCVAKARAIRAGFIEQKKKTGAKISLGDAIEKYISDNNKIFSPSTKRGYYGIRRNNFQEYMDVDIKTFTDWQAMVNEEASRYAPHTVKNAWSLVSSVLKANKIPVPEIHKPKKKKRKVLRPFLSFLQIPKFCEIIYGEECELGALLALSSLRRSELCAITANNISEDGKVIYVSGAIVPDETHKFVHKDDQKTEKSDRRVPVFIPRLRELLLKVDRSSDDFLVHWNPDALTKRINVLCTRAGLPAVGLQGLRRTFASLGHHLGLTELEVMEIGGWTNFKTIHEHYLLLDEMEKDISSEKLNQYFAENVNLLTDFHTHSTNPHE